MHVHEREKKRERERQREHRERENGLNFGATIICYALCLTHRERGRREGERVVWRNHINTAAKLFKNIFLDKKAFPWF